MTTCCAHLNRAQNRRPCSDLQELCGAANFAIGHYPCAGRFVLELRCLVHRHNNSHAIMISDTNYGGLSKIKMCITQPPLHVHNEDSTVENGRKLPRADFLCGWLPRSSIVKAPGCAARDGVTMAKAQDERSPRQLATRRISMPGRKVPT